PEANRRRARAAISLADGPVVARFFTASGLLCAQRVELLLRHVVVVGVAGGDELLGDLPVARQALHLEERALVPVEAEPAHALEDRVHRGFGRALEVGILDAQDELAAVAPRVGPAEERGARAADVQGSGRAGREPGADFHQSLP